jgi:hypothetical protein
MTRQLSIQVASFAFAAFMTLAMLGSVNGYATAQPSPQLVAHVTQSAAQS